MTLDLASRQDILEIKALLQELYASQTAKPVPANEPLMDVQSVADYTHFDRKTVEKWVKKGEYNGTGRLVYLPAFQFGGRLRFKRADVEAFGLGTGVLVPSIKAGEAPVATKPTKQPKKSKTPVASEKALRRVA
jgi:excisionase family DNA binding protein